MSFKDFLLNDKNLADFITSFGKGKDFKPFKKEVIPGLISYSLYNAKGQEANKIMVAAKTADFKSGEIDEFLNRSAIYATRILRSLDVDIIVTPISSSDLTKEFVKRIKERSNYDVFIDSFRKQPDISKVEIDYDNPKITPLIIKSMEDTLDRAKRRNNLSVKMFSPMHRKFIKNMFEITDPKLLAKFEDKNVIIIDDIMTSGTSAKNIYDVLITNNAKTVNILTIFKST